MNSKLDFHAIIHDIESLQPISSVTHHLLDVLEDEDATAIDIVELIKYEPTVTTNLIRTCNSASIGRTAPIDSVKDAVLALGIEKVADIVMVQCSKELLEKGKIASDDPEGVLWKLSVSSAVMAKHLTLRTVSTKSKNLLFTAALIKDIGKTILNRYVNGSSDDIQHLVDSKNYSHSQAEKEVLGIDHAEIGSMIAKSWNFSERMEHIIRNHHNQDPEVLNDTDCAIVCLADTICMLMGLGGYINRNDHKLYEAAMKSLGITIEEQPELIADFSEEISRVEKLLMVV